MAQFTSITVIYILVLFNSASLNGNILVIGMFFGLSEVVGILFGEQVMKWFHPVKGQIGSVSILLFICTFIKTFEIS